MGIKRYESGNVITHEAIDASTWAVLTPLAVAVNQCGLRMVARESVRLANVRTLRVDLIRHTEVLADTAFARVFIAFNMETGTLHVSTVHRKTGAPRRVGYRSMEEAVSEVVRGIKAREFVSMKLKDVRNWLCDIYGVPADTKSREVLAFSGDYLTLDAALPTPKITREESASIVELESIAPR
jgi:hypothetical protein